MIYLELFLTFLKIGAFTFGGGYAMLPLVQAEVEAHGWMKLAVNISTYVGMETGGLAGAFFATLGVVLPSFVIILLVAKCFQKFKSSRVISGAMAGLKPAVIGLIGSAVISVGQTVFLPSGGFVLNPAFLVSAVIFVSCLLFMFKKLHPILIIVLAAVLGIAAGYLGWIP